MTKREKSERLQEFILENDFSSLETRIASLQAGQTLIYAEIIALRNLIFRLHTDPNISKAQLRLLWPKIHAAAFQVSNIQLLDFYRKCHKRELADRRKRLNALLASAGKI